MCGHGTWPSMQPGPNGRTSDARASGKRRCTKETNRPLSYKHLRQTWQRKRNECAEHWSTTKVQYAHNLQMPRPSMSTHNSRIACLHEANTQAIDNENTPKHVARGRGPPNGNSGKTQRLNARKIVAVTCGTLPTKTSHAEPHTRTTNLAQRVPTWRRHFSGITRVKLTGRIKIDCDI
jgi:hypothetical protein